MVDDSVAGLGLLARILALLSEMSYLSSDTHACLKSNGPPVRSVMCGFNRDRLAAGCRTLLAVLEDRLYPPAADSVLYERQQLAVRSEDDCIIISDIHNSNMAMRVYMANSNGHKVLRVTATPGMLAEATVS